MSGCEEHAGGQVVGRGGIKIGLVCNGNKYYVANYKRMKTIAFEDVLLMHYQNFDLP